MFVDSDRIDSKYSSAIDFMVANGVISGYSDGTFRPDSPVVTVHALRMLCKCGAINEASCGPRTQLSSNWVDRYLDVCENIGIISAENERDSENYAQPLQLKAWRKIAKKFKTYLLNQYGVEEESEEVLPDTAKRCSNEVITRGQFCTDLYCVIADVAQMLDKRIYSLREAEKLAEAAEFISQISGIVRSLLADSESVAILKNLQVKSKENIQRCLQIAQVLFKRRIHNALYHYTTLAALEKMTQNSMVKLRASNTAYLNDPQEGKLPDDMKNTELQELFDAQCDAVGPDVCLNNKGEILSQHNAYVLSFTDSKEADIPMWIYYADQGNGCRIEFDVADKTVPIYKVIYEENELKAALESIRSALEQWGYPEAILPYAKKVASQLLYLYKKKHFSYEHEARLVLMCEPDDPMVHEEVREGEVFPRIYAESPVPTPIKSVVLGPKVAAPEQIAMVLYHRGIKSVSCSDIQLR